MGDNPSITNALFALSELADPFTGRVNSAALLSLSFIVPLFNDNELILV